MTGLLDAVLEAHGGLDRWQRFSTIEATIVSGGKLWEIKGQPQDPTPRRMTVALQREWAPVRPFGAADQKTDFTPRRAVLDLTEHSFEFPDDCQVSVTVSAS
jgi:hypothetical protein